MKKALFVIAVLMAAVSVNAQSWTPRVAGDHLFDTQSFLRLSRGDLTWSAAVSAMVPAGEKGITQTIDAQAAIGYFVDDRIEIEGVLNWMKLGQSSGASIGAGANYYFFEHFEGTYPYVGLGLSTWFYGMKERGTRCNAKVGIRHLFTPHLGLRVWGQYDVKMASIHERQGVFTAYVGVFALSH